MTHENAHERTHKQHEKTASHLAPARVGGEFDEYDAQGILPIAVRRIMGEIVTATRSVEPTQRQPAEIARLATIDPDLKLEHLEYIDVFATHVAHKAVRLPKHRKGDDEKRQAQKAPTQTPTDLTMPL